jgi:bla regulator protein BlaR1
MNQHLIAIGPALANHLWQTTAFVAAIWLTTLALRKNQARVRYALWLAASIKFLLPFSLLIALGGMLPKPQRAVTAPAVYATVDEVAQPFSQFDSTPIPAAPVPTLMERVEAHAPMTLAGIWLCGVVVLLALWGARWLQVWRTLRHATRAVSGREFDLLQRVSPGVGVHGGVTLRLSRELMEPGILGLGLGMGIGIFRPVLIWPEQLSAHLDDEHIEAILIHELAHARRRDNLTAALHMLVTALFWFHPLVWWMERRMIEERERACDEAVVATGSRPGIYAESLLKACRFCIESPLTCVAGITGADLRDRIVQIMTARISHKLTAANKLLLISAALLIVAAPILLGQGRAAVRIEAMAIKLTPAPVQAAANAMIVAVQTPPDATVAPAQIAANSTEPAADPCTMKSGATFDVVSIRPSKVGSGESDSDSNGDEVDSSGSLRSLIEEAYGLRDFQIAGGPDWMVTQTFDIKAKFDPDQAGSAKVRRSNDPHWAQRYQSLLVDRFHFKCHMTTQQLPVYDLVVTKRGTKMKVATSEESKGASISAHNDGHGGRNAIGTGVPIQGLMAMLTRSVGQTIVDKTGLAGSYDFTLNWAPTNRRAPEDAGGGVPLPELPEALEEQLGLKLVPAKGPVPVMDVDHVEKPELEGAEVQTAQAAVKPVAQEDPAAAYVPTMTFDVASIRQNKVDVEQGFTVAGWFTPNDSSHLQLQNWDIWNLVSGAYGVDAHAMQGLQNLPATLRGAVFSVQAKGDPENDVRLATLPTKERVLEQEHMVRVLLEQRMGLKAHWETQDGKTYDLVVSKAGRLKSTGASPSAEELKAFGDRGVPSIYQSGSSMHGFDYIAHDATIGDIAKMLGEMFGHPVIDKTGLTGKYDFDLKTYNTRRTEKREDETNHLPSLDDAIEDELGLKIVPSRGSVQVLVIDHLEMPSEN